MADHVKAVVGGCSALLLAAGGFGTAMLRDVGPFADDLAKKVPKVVPDAPNPPQVRPRVPVEPVPTVPVPDPPHPTVRVPDLVPSGAAVPPGIGHYPVPEFPGVRIPDDSVDALTQGYVPEGVKESIRLVRAWRNGEDMEKALGKTVCRVLSRVIDAQPEQDQWEQMLRDDFALTYSGPGSEQVANLFAPKIATGLWLMQRNSRAAYWYFQHCRFA